jgi:plastocyanin
MALATVATAMPAGAQQSGPREIIVTMDNMVFGRMPTDAKVGDTIIWVNNDTVQHTATARDGSFDVRLQPGKRGRTTLTKAGNLAIYCIYHPMMRTTLRVAAA